VLRNATRKRPQDFFVFISDDDGLDTREEEQFYLDFYHNTPWCYNISPNANGGHICHEYSSRGGQKSGRRNFQTAAKKNKGKKMPEKTREKMREYHKNRSEKHKENLRIATEGRKERNKWGPKPPPLQGPKPLQRKKKAVVLGPRIDGRRKPAHNRVAVEVTQVKTGETWVFQSITEACKMLNLNVAKMSEVANGKRKSYKGHIARRVG
jgi:hypothetical protein